ncbi:MAG TPA: HmuY family protein, partial [Polyangiales bacterium]
SQTDSVYFDLDTGSKVSEDQGWDLSFKRFHIQLNGGVSGSGGVQALVLEGREFDALEEAPLEGFSSDEPDADADNDSDPDNVFCNGESDWYEYDVGDHTLTSRQLTYVIASDQQKLYKLVLDGYYDAAGSPAQISFRWARLQGPAPEPGEPSTPDDAGEQDPPDAVTGASSADAGERDAGLPDASQPDASQPDAGESMPSASVTVSATSASEWVYLNAAGQVVTPADPATSLEWDLAFKRTELRTNSGSSGAGRGGAKLETRALAYDAISAADGYDFGVDTLFSSGAPGAAAVSQSSVLGKWYDYNPTTHVVSPGERTYIVRGAQGGLHKLRIVKYESGMFQLRLTPIQRTAREIDVDASASNVWAYVSLREGASVEVSAPLTDLRWDVALSRVRLRTNSGTSGSGMGGAADAANADPGAPGAVPAGFTVDAETSGNGGTISSNAALDAWYDYDVMTHVVSPKAKAFVVKTADGGLGALRVIAYNSGTYRLGISYAGAGASSF